MKNLSSENKNGIKISVLMTLLVFGGCTFTLLKGKMTQNDTVKKAAPKLQPGFETIEQENARGVENIDRTMGYFKSMMGLDQSYEEMESERKSIQNDTDQRIREDREKELYPNSSH